MVRGWVRRDDLMRHFQVSGAVATADLAAYLRLNPHGMGYSRVTRRYESVAPERRMFARKRELVARIESVFAFTLADGFQSVDLPHRAFEPKIATAVTRAILNRQEIEIKYLSVSSDTAQWRWVTPVGLVNDGFRFHLRAWCSQKTRFADFNLGRILSIRNARAGTASLRDDREYGELVKVVVAPTRGLGSAQRRAVEMDFRMTDGRLQFEARRSHLLYVLVQLGVLPSGTGRLLQLVKPHPRSTLFLSVVRPEP